jgi:hypothetical protein
LDSVGLIGKFRLVGKYIGKKDLFFQIYFLKNISVVVEGNTPMTGAICKQPQFLS